MLENSVIGERPRVLSRCIHNRTDDDCGYFKWADELEDPSYVTHYELNCVETRISKKLDSIVFMMKVFVAVVVINIIIRFHEQYLYYARTDHLSSKCPLDLADNFTRGRFPAREVQQRRSGNTRQRGRQRRQGRVRNGSRAERAATRGDALRAAKLRGDASRAERRHAATGDAVTPRRQSGQSERRHAGRAGDTRIRGQASRAARAGRATSYEMVKI
ncbi:hypothetical protein IEQ34_004037 [Dendrobium chrysotoxum]|uniref:Zinc finger GRF-type domain-containing protein n=1 Tax=Dendrobium chrysotoxum TaxID=161865 RepID=A0AAV7GZ35_DENCH|nr:hypothetical protein IEQ34_004037 [Dendrobium chrysotoxum]